MLTREDIDDLFDLLAIFRKNDPHLRENGLRSAWLLVLSPYNRDDVRKAVGAWFRKSKYWPEPAEIAALCPQLPQPEHVNAGASAEHPEWHRSRDPVWIRWDALVEKRRKAGIQATLDEAEKTGLSHEEWLDIIEERGLGFFD